MPLSPPFPHFGGKRRFAPLIWSKFGNVTVYVEPCVASGAVLLYRDNPAPREVICDTNAHVSNFYRSMQADEEAVAYHADYPSYHDDLYARHKWLVAWARRNAAIVRDDPHYYDPEAAGWWAWGMSLWVGSGFCLDKDLPTIAQVPGMNANLGGRGINMQRENVYDKRPRVASKIGGRGVDAQRTDLPLIDKRPHIKDHLGGSGVDNHRIDVFKDAIPAISAKVGGKGVGLQRAATPWEQRPIMQGQGINVQRSDLHSLDETPGARLLPWFRALARRLRKVIVLNRSWESAVTPTILMHTKHGKKPPVGIFLDPPYKTNGRKRSLYQSDVDGTSDAVAEATYEWAVAHGETYRIAYACAEGDFPVPEGWTSTLKSFAGHNTSHEFQDMVMFSPTCLEEPPQGKLWE